MISHIQNEILKQKNFTGSGFTGTPKLLKDFFSKLILCQARFQLKLFSVHWFEIWQFYSKVAEVQKRVSVF